MSLWAVMAFLDKLKKSFKESLRRAAEKKEKKGDLFEGADDN